MIEIPLAEALKQQQQQQPHRTANNAAGEFSNAKQLLAQVGSGAECLDVWCTVHGNDHFF